MNLIPPPIVNNIVSIRKWLYELYTFLQRPYFPGGARFGTTANYLDISNNGTVALAGDARVKHEVAFPLDAIGRGATAPTLTRFGNTVGYAFTIGDDGYMSFEVPPDWDSSTNIEILLHVYTDEAYVTNSGELRFAANWAAIPEDGSEAVDGATHTGTLDSGDINLPATAKALLEIEIGEIAAASLAAHDVVCIKLSRVAVNDGNDSTAEPVVIGAEYEWTANKLGEV